MFNLKSNQQGNDSNNILNLLQDPSSGPVEEVLKETKPEVPGDFGNFDLLDDLEIPTPQKSEKEEVKEHSKNNDLLKLDEIDNQVEEVKEKEKGFDLGIFNNNPPSNQSQF